jgi:acetolactate synthase-1/2/3 large subunit
MKPELTVADYFARFIAEKKVSAVYELSGGMIAFLSDAIYRFGKTPIINTRHEQTAGFAAEAATRATGIPNVAMGTSGPGATNLITAIGSSYFDSTPTIFITGQVHTKELRKNLSQRQNGFQELDIVEATKGFTKFAYQVTSADEFPAILEKAWNIATEGRPGPVLLDIPIDIQQVQCEALISNVISEPKHIKVPNNSFDIILEKIKSAKRPLILAGGGIRSSNSHEEFLKFVRKSNIPVVLTLMGKDLMPTSDLLNLGFIGSYGNRWANRALSKADLLIVVGSRLDVRQTGNDLSDFVSNKYIVRIDIDEHELSGRVNADLNLAMGLKDFFRHINTLEIPYTDNLEVLNETESVRRDYSPDAEQEVGLKLSPDACMRWISKIGSGAAGYCVDVGQHQMWAAQSLHLLEDQRFMTSGGMGAMGFSIPAAIGVATSTKKCWITITGDGCMQLTSNELETIRHYNLPIIMFVINNGQHGMVAQFQEENMDSRYVSTRIGYSTPDFANIAKAYGLDAYKISSFSDFGRVEQALRSNPQRPCVIEIEIDNRAKALPKIDRFTKLSEL